MFNGITLGERHQYRIKCIEYQDANPVTAKPKTTYKLIECTRLSSLWLWGSRNGNDYSENL